MRHAVLGHSSGLFVSANVDTAAPACAHSAWKPCAHQPPCMLLCLTTTNTPANKQTPNRSSSCRRRWAASSRSTPSTAWSGPSAWPSASAPSQSASWCASSAAGAPACPAPRTCAAGGAVDAGQPPEVSLVRAGCRCLCVDAECLQGHGVAHITVCTRCCMVRRSGQRLVDGKVPGRCWAAGRSCRLRLSTVLSGLGPCFTPCFSITAKCPRRVLILTCVSLPLYSYLMCTCYVYCVHVQAPASTMRLLLWPA